MPATQRCCTAGCLRPTQLVSRAGPPVASHCKPKHSSSTNEEPRLGMPGSWLLQRAAAQTSWQRPGQTLSPVRGACSAVPLIRLIHIRKQTHSSHVWRASFSTLAAEAGADGAPLSPALPAPQSVGTAEDTRRLTRRKLAGRATGALWPHQARARLPRCLPRRRRVAARVASGSWMAASCV